MSVRIKNKRVRTIILTIVLILILLVWAPWITDDYAINKVVEKLGGPDTRFNYLARAQETLSNITFSITTLTSTIASLMPTTPPKRSSRGGKNTFTHK